MPPGRPRSPRLRLRDLVYLSLLIPAHAAAALQKQPAAYYPHAAAADGLANAAAAAEQRQYASVADTLGGQRGFRETDVRISNNNHLPHHNKNDKNVRTAHNAHPSDGALATVSSPAESNSAAAAGHPPAPWSSAPSAGLTSRQPARSLQDWQVEDIMLLATVDGKLHARDRKTGAERWVLESEGEMVESTRHRHNKTYDENGLEQEDPTFVVEPALDGIIYIMAPGFGLQKLPYSVKQLAELSPYAGDGWPAVAYTAEKRNTLYTVDAATGHLLKVFSAAGSMVNDDRSCRRASPLDLEESECEPIGTLTLGRTEYTIGIQDRNTGEPINTLRYFEWGPNNRDHDLRKEYQESRKTIDRRYIYPKRNGRVLSMDLEHARSPSQKTVKWQKKFSSPVVRVFDVVRPRDDMSSDASLVILQQPTPPSTFDKRNIPSEDTTFNVWVNCTDNGNWYALSEENYPMVTEDAPAAGYYEQGSTRGMPITKKLYTGVHFLDLPQSGRGSNQIGGRSLLTIDAPESQIIGDAPYLDGEKSLISGDTRSQLNTLGTIILTVIVVVAVTFLFIYKQYGLAPWQIRKALPPAKIHIPAGHVEAPGIETPKIREDEPAEETIFPNQVSTPPKVSFADIPEEDVLKETTPEGEDVAKEATPTEPKKKKATRGKRAGKKQREKEISAAEARAKKNGTPVTPVPEAVEVISVADSESPQVTGALQINSLIIYLDQVIGQGSCGTIVFKGNYEGRDVAVKRMLSQYYELASQEVSFLQQSDYHDNVIRYFCQQKDDHFLYIAVELCQASLFEVYEPEKAKTEERQQQLQQLKSSMQQDMTGTLQQLADGLCHLHKLRIIHRDIKPQNILVARPKRFDAAGKIRLVISDFGLGKNLPENVSTLVDPTGNAGTSGWKAPELISQPRETASNNTHSTSHASDGGVGSHSGVKRAADIFSLGCLFFWVLTDGVHPFEDENGWHQLRELNIKRDKKNMEALERWSDAYEPMQLITSMLSPLPEHRPTAQVVLNHPYFWPARKRLEFLCDCSDHFEREPRGTYEDDYAGDSDMLRFLEDRAEEVIGVPYERADFLSKLDRQFVDTLGRQRKYSGNRLLDLLRALRNKKNHYEDMPEHVKKLVGPLAAGYLGYWSQRFPKLLMVCYEVVHEASVQNGDRFKVYFELGTNS